MLCDASPQHYFIIWRLCDLDGHPLSRSRRPVFRLQCLQCRLAASTVTACWPNHVTTVADELAATPAGLIEGRPGHLWQCVDRLQTADRTILHLPSSTVDTRPAPEIKAHQPHLMAGQPPRLSPPGTAQAMAVVVIHSEHRGGPRSGPPGLDSARPPPLSSSRSIRSTARAHRF
ncbi:hypothetical protein OHA53_34950 [Streptomyces althioticus]|uniref:hypothetical protein n=1 Tax=Streptomyces althioticus TaxID=83380 RepID=UPI00387362CE|nr:hypothetical protein OHA53_34950 [Streptomyces althioticus]